MTSRIRTPYGKMDRESMEEVVYRNLGKKSRKVLRGPRTGFDNAVVRVGKGRVMVATTDPVSMVPPIGAELSAWMSVHLVASDLATSGVTPEFALFTLNFPRGLEEGEARDYLTSLGRSCSELGISIVGGHTGTYPGGGFTVIGGGTMMGFAGEGEYIDPSMSRVGDLVLMTKGAGIEAAATLAVSFPRYTKGKAGRKFQRNSAALLRSCSCVADALAAARVGLGAGGVTSMHDATEGGVLGGVSEMSEASGKAYVIDLEKVHVPEEVAAVCSAFSIDPMRTVSEGTLLITCSPRVKAALESALAERGIGAWEIGRVVGGRGAWSVGADGRRRRISPGPDEYWSAFDEAATSGLE